MNILMVTPHLPPYQAANALLPHLLGGALRSRGHDVRFLALGNGLTRADATFVRRRLPVLRPTRIPQLLEAFDTWALGGSQIQWADVVHVHSNTWMNQVAAGLAWRRGRPYVLTHYGTEIWHCDGRNRAFRRLNERAHHVTFYSQALLDHGRRMGVPARAASVVYPPVADDFRFASEDDRRGYRQTYLGVDAPLVLNVKRLHPLADQATLLRAFALLAERWKDARLLIAGIGEMEGALKSLAESLRLGDRVRFLGLVPNEEVARLQAAADVFVLSSVLEATPTVALEALASGTRVVSTDNPGGLELRTMFCDDVTVVPHENPGALARAVGNLLAAPARTLDATQTLIAERFRMGRVVERYLELYEEACRS